VQKASPDQAQKPRAASQSDSSSSGGAGDDIIFGSCNCANAGHTIPACANSKGGFKQPGMLEQSGHLLMHETLTIIAIVYDNS
jgi:hypothetical protein